MHLLMIIFRYLVRFLSGGAETVWGELGGVPIRMLLGPAGSRLWRPVLTHAGWMKVRPVLETFGGPPGRYAAGGGGPLGRPGHRRSRPVQYDRVMPRLTPGHCSSTDPPDLSLPRWG